MLTNGEKQYGDEDCELEDDAGRDRLLVLPRQDFVAPIEALGELTLLGPIGVEECLAFGHRRGDAAGPRVGRSGGPSRAPVLFGQPRSEHRCGQFGDGAYVRGEDVVGSSQPTGPAGVGLEEASVASHHVAAEPIFFVDHRRVGGALRRHRQAAPFELGRQPNPCDPVRERRQQARRGNERAQEYERPAELLRKRAILWTGSHGAKPAAKSSRE